MPKSITLKKHEESFIQDAIQFLDQPSFLLRLANQLGRPMELALASISKKHQLTIRRATHVALSKGLRMVTRTIGHHATNTADLLQRQKVSTSIGRWHSAASFGIGAAGGLFGILSLPLELPLTTAIILRSVASIADECGMDLNDPQVQLECLYILTLGSPRTNKDDAMASAYWASRSAFATLASEAVSYLAGKSSRQISLEIQRSSAPVLVRFISQVAARFEIVVGEKAMAEALPLIGAIGGGVVNAAFTDYFSQAAKFHFGLRALEMAHGRNEVEKYYARLQAIEMPILERSA